VFIGERLANISQVSDVAPGSLVLNIQKKCLPETKFQSDRTSVLDLKYEYELNCPEHSIFCKIHLKTKDVLPRAWLYLSVDLAQFHGTPFDFHPKTLTVFTFLWISNSFDLSITEET
jgi:hypothetical protein